MQTLKLYDYMLSPLLKVNILTSNIFAPVDFLVSVKVILRELSKRLTVELFEYLGG